jgi:hypothetical protein
MGDITRTQQSGFWPSDNIVGNEDVRDFLEQPFVMELRGCKRKQNLTPFQEELLDDSGRVVIVMPYDRRQAVLQSRGKSLDRKIEITALENNDRGL